MNAAEVRDSLQVGAWGDQRKTLGGHGQKRKRSKELRADWIHIGDGEAEGRTGAAGWKWGQK